MLRTILFIAVLTGVFCSGFAIAIDVFTDMLDRTNIIIAAFASGFLGSLFAQTGLARWKERRRIASQESEQ